LALTTAVLYYVVDLRTAGKAVKMRTRTKSKSIALIIERTKNSSFIVLFSFAFQLVLFFSVIALNAKTVDLTFSCLIALSIWNMAALSLIVRSIKFKAGEIFVRLFLIWHLLLPGAIQYSSDRFFWKPHSYSSEDATVALLIVFVAVLAIELCFSFRSKVEIHRHQPPPSRLSNLSIVIFIMLSSIAFLASVLYFGFNVILETRGNIGVIVESIITQEYEHVFFLDIPRAVTFCSFAISLLNLIALRHARQGTAFAYTGCMVLFCLYITLNFPFSLARFMFLGQMIIVTYIIFFFKNSYLNLFYIISYPVALYTIVPFLGVFSRYAEFDFDNAYQAFVSGLSESVYAGDYADFEMTIMAVQYVSSEGVRMGQQTLSALLFFLPRSIFTFKADPTNYLLADFFNFEYRNIASPFLAEFYIDFGFIGVFLGCFLYCSAVKMLQRRLQPYYGFSTLPAMAALAFLPIILRGSLLAVIGFSIVYPASFALLLFISRIRILSDRLRMVVDRL
jgi:oligosaccharide repeat unit polymerase